MTIEAWRSLAFSARLLGDQAKPIMAAAGYQTPVKDDEDDDFLSSPATASLAEYSDEMADIGLMMEYDELAESCLDGLLVLPDLRCLRIWHGVVFPPSGMYEGGAFRFVVGIPADYPVGETKPILRFVDIPYHPLISPTVRHSTAHCISVWNYLH